MIEIGSGGASGIVVSELLAAVERRDFDAIAHFYADDIEIWHSFSNATAYKDGAVKMLQSLGDFKSFSYEVQERYVDGPKVFQRHILHVTKADGQTVQIPTAAFITVKDGQIWKVFEYMDPSPLM